MGVVSRDEVRPYQISLSIEFSAVLSHGVLHLIDRLHAGGFVESAA